MNVDTRVDWGDWTLEIRQGCQASWKFDTTIPISRSYRDNSATLCHRGPTFTHKHDHSLINHPLTVSSHDLHLVKCIGAKTRKTWKLPNFKVLSKIN